MAVVNAGRHSPGSYLLAVSIVPSDTIPQSSDSALVERTFIKRVATGELPERLRTCVTGQLTENPARAPRGVRSFPASSGKGL
jgi:hypothetical protein